MAENTLPKYKFYQVASNDQITGLEIPSQYPVGSIVFNKTRREITVVSQTSANIDGTNANAIYGGGLQSATLSNEKLTIIDNTGHELEVNLGDFTTSTELTNALNSYVQKTTLENLTASFNTKFEEINTALGNKADKANTLQGYGIEDAYTKDQVDAKITATEKQLFVLIGAVPDHDSLYDITAIDNGKIGGTEGKDFIPNGAVSDLQVGYVVQVENDDIQNYVEYWFTGNTTLYGINIGQNTLDLPTTIYISRPWNDLSVGSSTKDVFSIYDEDGSIWPYYKALKTGANSLVIYEDNTAVSNTLTVSTASNKTNILYEASWNVLGSQATSLEGVEAALETKVDKTTYNAKVVELEGAIGNKVDTITYNGKIAEIEQLLCWTKLE